MAPLKPVSLLVRSVSPAITLVHPRIPLRKLTSEYIAVISYRLFKDIVALKLHTDLLQPQKMFLKIRGPFAKV